jgi:hypothetical protein
MERMAATQTFHTKPDTLHRPVDFDCLTHVRRTRWVKPAGGRQEGRDQAFVSVEGGDEGSADKAAAGTSTGGTTAGGIAAFADAVCFPHRMNRRLTSAWSSGNVQSSTLRRGLKTIDHSGLRFARSRRTASRTRRLTRLRLTALPSALGVVNPTRGRVCAESATQKAAKRGHVKRVPWS